MLKEKKKKIEYISRSKQEQRFFLNILFRPIILLFYSEKNQNYIRMHS